MQKVFREKIRRAKALELEANPVLFSIIFAQVAELVYAYDSKSYDHTVMWVQIPPWALVNRWIRD